MQDYGVSVIDSNYVAPESAACFLIQENSKAVFIENNTNFAHSILMQKLEENNIKPEDVEYIIVTHSHLDHAGGTTYLMQKCKNAKLVAHPKAAHLLKNPTKLIAGAKQIYGEDKYIELYGKDVLAAPEDRVYVPEDGETLKFYDREFKFIYTKGHSTDHFCIYDSKSNGVFTGDSFGVSYPEMRTDKPFIFPTTAPMDFDPEEAIISMNKIVGTGASRIYLTHFGIWDNPELGRELLMKEIESSKRIIEEVKNSSIPKEKMEEFCIEKSLEHIKNKFKEHNVVMNDRLEKRLFIDSLLNGKGIYAKMNLDLEK